MLQYEDLFKSIAVRFGSMEMLESGNMIQKMPDGLIREMVFLSGLIIIK